MCSIYIYICVLGNYFRSMRQGMRLGNNHSSSTYASWSRLTNSCFDGNNKYPTFSWLGHVKYAPGVCATVRPLRAEPKAPMDCMGQSSFETGYAPGMRQPHSSLVILFQLEHGEDPATVRPLRAEVPVHPLCWFLSKSKYALGMRWTFFRPRTRLTYAPEVCARTKTLCSVCVLPREKEVCAQVCAEPKAPMDCLGQSSFETGYATGMR